MKEKIQSRIDGYQKELDKWNAMWKQVEDGEIPNMPAFTDMVLRNQAMYIHQIVELKWVLEQMKTPEHPTKTLLMETTPENPGDGSM
jgi:hypothetical protein